MTKETQANSYEAGVYSYDGDGRRVKRKVGSVETWQVYGLGGELVAEYGANTAASSPQKEYGYRNGQLLLTITSGSGWGSVPSLDDNPLNPPNQPKTDVKAIHITQLRTAINALRSHYNLPAYQWQKPTASGGAINSAVLISWEPIDEMRTAIDQAIGPPPMGYSAGLAYGQPIKAVHIQELRDRLLQVWSADIRWLVMDQLGTPRMIFDQSGSLATVSRHDYLPFGEELFAGSGGRTTAQGYTNNDVVRQKFTSKERDSETGLDYFKARYYSSSLGRFTSPDSFGGLKVNPQSLNRYGYVHNNPLRFTDPTGHMVEPWINPLHDWFGKTKDVKYMWGQNPSRPQDPNKPSLQPAIAPAGVPDIPEGTIGTPTVTEWHPLPPHKSFWERVKTFFGFGSSATAATAASMWGKPETLQDHFERHGPEFGARTSEEYAQQAQEFFVRAVEDGLPMKIGPDGVIRVYEAETNTFASYNMNGTTRTMFRPSGEEFYWMRQPGRVSWTPQEEVEPEIEPEIEPEVPIPLEPIP